MGVIVTFDHKKWLARYPEFSAVSDELGAELFAEATMFHGNDGSGPINDAAMQLRLLNMLTAHIAALNGYGNKPGGIKRTPGAVGRLSQASEGSVSVTLDMGASTDERLSWLSQTQYGMAYWEATKNFRSFLYRMPAGRLYNRYS